MKNIFQKQIITMTLLSATTLCLSTNIAKADNVQSKTYSSDNNIQSSEQNSGQINSRQDDITTEADTKARYSKDNDDTMMREPSDDDGIAMNRIKNNSINDLTERNPVNSKRNITNSNKYDGEIQDDTMDRQ